MITLVGNKLITIIGRKYSKCIDAYRGRRRRIALSEYNNIII